MVVVHIHGGSCKHCIHKYIRHNACWLCEWQGTQVQYEPDNITIRQVVANFRTETCTITRVAGTTQVFYAKWEDA